MMHWILNEAGEPVPIRGMIRWAKFWSDPDLARRAVVARTEIGTVTVATDFLLASIFPPSGPTNFWETMVFGGALDQEMFRCSGSREQALAMHADIVTLVRRAERGGAGVPPPKKSGRSET